MNTWFRLYAEFEDDPKVQMLPEHMQRRLVMLLCSRCKEVKLTEDQMAFKWRISKAEIQETKTVFLEQGFIDEEWNLVNWNKRQFISDSSTDRVRKHRTNHAVKQDETLHGTERNVTVTAPDSDTDSDTDSEQTQKVSDANASSPRRVAVGACVDPHEAIYDEYPRKEGKRKAMDAINKAIERIHKGECQRTATTRREAQVFLFRRVQAYARSPAGSRPDKTLIPHPATWFNQSRYLDDESNWQTGVVNARVNQNLQALQESIASRSDRDGAVLDGNDARGEAGQGNPFALLRSLSARAV